MDTSKETVVVSRREKTRTFAIDEETDRMLRVISNNKMSAWLKRTVAIEYGKRLGMELAKHDA